MYEKPSHVWFDRQVSKVGLGLSVHSKAREAGLSLNLLIWATPGCCGLLSSRSKFCSQAHSHPLPWPQPPPPPFLSLPMFWHLETLGVPFSISLVLRLCYCCCLAFQSKEWRLISVLLTYSDAATNLQLSVRVSSHWCTWTPHSSVSFEAAGKPVQTPKAIFKTWWAGRHMGISCHGIWHVAERRKEKQLLHSGQEEFKIGAELCATTLKNSQQALIVSG